MRLKLTVSCHENIDGIDVFATSYCIMKDSFIEDTEACFSYPEKLGSAPAKDLWRLLTLHVRKDPFVDGHLPLMVENGHITACLRRLSSFYALDPNPDGAL